jgi:putative transposase
MARPQRFYLPGQPQHVIQRGNNRSLVFLGDGDHEFYLQCLREAATRYGCAVHAYVLMSNHTHLLITPATADALPRTMQSLGRRFAQFSNWRRERTGSLWEGRPRITPIDTDDYFFTCSRYIELNPVRAGMVRRAADYRWSSYAANVQGRRDPLITSHDLYESLGTTPTERQDAYRQMFDDDLTAAELARIREATQKGWPLGGDGFRSALARITQQRTRPAAKGGWRPRAGRPRSGDGHALPLREPIDPPAPK